MLRLICLLIGLVVCLSPIGCVKIQTGNSPDEQRESSSEMADRLRGEWAGKIRAATPLEKAQLLIELYQQVVEAHFRFGREIALKWEETQKQRGVEIPTSDIQSMIDRWLNSEGPILNAYRDNLEYTREQMILDEYFGQNFLDATGQLLDRETRVREVVFAPSGSLDDYEYDLQQQEFRSSEDLDRVRELLKSQ